MLQEVYGMVKHHPLFTPAQLGSLLLKNRIIMAPMTTRHADKEGYVTAHTKLYYQKRAQGGVGLITVEMAAPEKCGRHRHNELGLYDDKFLDGLRSLVHIIHAEGAKVSIQIGHGGGHTRLDISGEDPIAPSAVVHSVHEGHTELIIPQAMSLERIRQTQASFVDAAIRAQKAGFDAVEIHGAHGYLLSQFLSTVENVRSDQYGQTDENRARFSIEIIRQIKQKAPDLVVIFRMNADDFFEGGIELPQAVQMARWIEDAGADAIHVTAGHYRSQPNAAIMIPPMAAGRMPFRAYAKAVKEAVGIPVISVGRYGNPRDAMDALETGDTDFIAMGRPLLADPDWVRKVQNNEIPTPCIACNTCVDGMRDGHKLHCLVNPITGRETDYPASQPAIVGKRIGVIGAGSAGLSFAGLMAETNQVTLFEKQMDVGGSFLVAGYAPKFQTVDAVPESFAYYIESMKRNCENRGVDIQTGTDPFLDPDVLKTFDWIVIATGAQLPFGLQSVVNIMLRQGLFKAAILKLLASQNKIRNLFYYRFRRPTAKTYLDMIPKDCRVSIIGDAYNSGKASEAIKSAYDLAFSSHG
jgi:2,4-dienoyl-CoA reductase-like NADH-dependent reductase (Old Yellow Enzyme family)